MADPISATLAGIGIAGTAAGGIVGGIGAGESAAANAAAYQYKAGVALLNKKINDQNAEFAIEEGAVKGEEYGLQAGERIAETKVVQAASGFDVNTGSNLATRNSQITAAGFDQQVIEWDAEKTAYGFEAKAMTDVAEANLDTMAAAQAKKAGFFGEITSFLTAGTSVATKWSQAKTSGAFG